MKINYKKSLPAVLSLMIFLPFVVSAYSGLIPCDGVTKVCDFNALSEMINNFINRFLGISVSIAAITISIAGAQILLNPENPSKIQDGWSMLRKTATGMLLILGAWIVIHTLVSALVNPDTGALRFLAG